jgi:carboxylesterase
MTIIDRSSFLVGSKTGILLIHGLGGTPVEMRYVAQGLNRAGYTVYSCQLTGHCGTTQDLIEAKWQDWTADVVKALDKLKHCSKIFVGGLSAGSLLALYLAEQFPDKIDGTLLYSPTLVLNGWSMPWYMRFLHYLRPSMQFMEVMMNERQPHGLKDERIRKLVIQSMQANSTDAGTFQTPLSTMTQFNALSAYMRKRLKNITVPILSFHPREDDFSDISNSYEILRKVKGKAELVVLEDSYHIITLDKQRSHVLYKSEEFIENIRITDKNKYHTLNIKKSA